jgi:hypothetical protein
MYNDNESNQSVLQPRSPAYHIRGGGGVFGRSTPSYEILGRSSSSIHSIRLNPREEPLFNIPSLLLLQSLFRVQAASSVEQDSDIYSLKRKQNQTDENESQRQDIVFLKKVHWGTMPSRMERSWSSTIESRVSTTYLCTSSRVFTWVLQKQHRNCCSCFCKSVYSKGNHLL